MGPPKLCQPFAVPEVAVISTSGWSIHRTGGRLIVLLIVALFPARYTPGRDLFGAVIFYTLAKAGEEPTVRSSRRPVAS
jgi:hypothetical protein